MIFTIKKMFFCFLFILCLRRLVIGVAVVAQERNKTTLFAEFINQDTFVAMVCLNADFDIVTKHVAGDFFFGQFVAEQLDVAPHIQVEVQGIVDVFVRLTCLARFASLFDVVSANVASKTTTDTVACATDFGNASVHDNHVEPFTLLF